MGKASLAQKMRPTIPTVPLTAPAETTQTPPPKQSWREWMTSGWW